MEVKNNLLVKDLKYFSWFHAIRNSLITIGNLQPSDEHKLGYLSVSIWPLLKEKGLFLLSGYDNLGGIKDSWRTAKRISAAFDLVIGNLQPHSQLGGDAFIIKDGLLRQQITEMREAKYLDAKTGEVSYVTEESFWVEKGGLYFLEVFLFEALRFWFVFPSFINDLYKHSLENNQSTQIEELFLKAWLELPSVIDELYLYLREVTKVTGFKLHDYINSEITANFQQLKEYPGFLILDHFSLTPSLVDAKWAELTPFSQELLKVASKIPFHLQEYLNFLKLSLEGKSYAFRFDYFFQLLMKKEASLTKITASNFTWKLLMYNTPFPSYIIKEIEEERKAKSRKTALGAKIFDKDNPGGLMFHLNNLSKGLAEESKNKKKE